MHGEKGALSHEHRDECQHEDQHGAANRQDDGHEGHDGFNHIGVGGLAVGVGHGEIPESDEMPHFKAALWPATGR